MIQGQIRRMFDISGINTKVHIRLTVTAGFGGFALNGLV